MTTGPDELLPRAIWLLRVLPPPRFSAAMADEAFRRENVSGPLSDVARQAFATLEEWGYRPIGRYDGAPDRVEALGYSSRSTTVWVVFFMEALAVLVTPGAERDPSRLNHHLSAPGARERVAVWGSFPVASAHLPSAAERFLEVAHELQSDDPNLETLRSVFERAASELGTEVSERASLIAARELAGRGRHRAAVRALSPWEHDLEPADVALLEAERRAASFEAPVLVRAGRSDRDWFIALAEHINLVDGKLKSAVGEHASSRDASAAWTDSAADLHDALELLYHDLELAIQRSNAGDADATERLVAFLEADPWCFRSGYLKGRVYESLRRAHLTDSTKERLRIVLLNAVDVGYRREFRSSCRLARVVADAALIAELRRRLDLSLDRHVPRRAMWMLAYVPGGLEGQGPAVLDLLIDSADDAEWLRVSTWVRQLCRRFTNDAFDKRVRGMALSSDEATARRGLRLLPSAIRRPLDAGERLALEPRIIDAAHGRGPGINVIESLAAIADSKRLRRRLADLATNASSPVNRYASWGLNAARRANGEEPPDP